MSKILDDLARDREYVLGIRQDRSVLSDRLEAAQTEIAEWADRLHVSEAAAEAAETARAAAEERVAGIKSLMDGLGSAPTLSKFTAFMKSLKAIFAEE